MNYSKLHKPTDKDVKEGQPTTDKEELNNERC